jgi:hypothetical protein
MLGVGAAVYSTSPLLRPQSTRLLLANGLGFFRSDYVVANFLLPRLKNNNSGLTQTLVKLRCQIPELL